MSDGWERQMDGSISFILGVALFFLLNLFIFRGGFSSKIDSTVPIMTKLVFVSINILLLLLVILARLLL